MINSLEILEQLKKGKSIERIGDEIAAVLNVANAEYIKYQKEQEAKKAEAEKRQNLINCLTSLISWGKMYYPKYFDKEDIDAESLADTIFELFELFDQYGEYITKPSSLLQYVVPSEEETKSKKNVGDWDSILKNFLGND